MNSEICAKQLRLINRQTGACELGESLDYIFHECNWVQWNCNYNYQQIETMNKLPRGGHVELIGETLHSKLQNDTQFKICSILTSALAEMFSSRFTVFERTSVTTWRFSDDWSSVLLVWTIMLIVFATSCMFSAVICICWKKWKTKVQEISTRN